MNDRSSWDDQDESAALLGDLRGQKRKDDRKLPLSESPPELPEPPADPEPPARRGLWRRRDR